MDRKPLAAGGGGQVYKGTYGKAQVAVKSIFSQMMHSSNLTKSTTK